MLGISQVPAPGVDGTNNCNRKVIDAKSPAAALSEIFVGPGIGSNKKIKFTRKTYENFILDQITRFQKQGVEKIHYNTDSLGWYFLGRVLLGSQTLIDPQDISVLATNPVVLTTKLPLHLGMIDQYVQMHGINIDHDEVASIKSDVTTVDQRFEKYDVSKLQSFTTINNKNDVLTNESGLFNVLDGLATKFENTQYHVYIESLGGDSAIPGHTIAGREMLVDSIRAQSTHAVLNSIPTAQ